MNTSDYSVLYELLKEAGDEINTAPERHESTSAGCLAESDWQVLLLARSVAHRLMLWHQYPGVSPESYLAKEEMAA